LLALVLPLFEESQGVIIELLNTVKALDYGIHRPLEGRFLRPKLPDLRLQFVDLKVSG
jgi:hypothetical protein